MSGETKAEESGWSVDTLKSYLDQRLEALHSQINREAVDQKERVEVAMKAADKTTAIAQATADKAVMKAEAAATKDLLESQIIAVKEFVVTKSDASDRRHDAALASAKEAIEKSEQNTSDKFLKTNEFRAQLDDQAKTFARREEMLSRFGSVDKALDEILAWQRRMELKFNEYLRIETFDKTTQEYAAWRRVVDTALTAAASRNGTAYALFAMGVAAITLIIAVYNLFNKATVGVP